MDTPGGLRQQRGPVQPGCANSAAAAAPNADFQLAAGHAARAPRFVGQAHADDRRIIDQRDRISRINAGHLGRRVYGHCRRRYVGGSEIDDDANTSALTSIVLPDFIELVLI